MKYFFVVFGFWILMILPFTKATISALPKNSTVPQKELGFYVEVLKYEQCPEFPNTKLVFQNASIDRKVDSYRLSAIVNVTQELKGPLYMGAKIERCKSKIDSCEIIFNTVLQNLCEDLKNNQSEGYEVMHDYLNFENPKCPLPEGVHSIVSKPFDAKRFESYAIGVKFYKFHFYFYDADKKTPNSCMYFELAFHQKDKRSRQINIGK